MPIGVLLTSASRKVGLVRAFQAAVATLGGGRVLATDISPLAPALYAADAGRIVPRSDDPGYVDALLRLCADEGISLVVPTRDEELPDMARARSRALDRGVTILVPDADTVSVCQDKRAFAAACSAAGLTTPRTLDHFDAGDLPLFIRPRSGKGGVGARAVRTPAELALAIGELGERALAQELVEAPELTVDLFVDPRDGRPISCVPRERLLVIAGESYVGRTVRDDRLRDATLRLAAALRLTGHVTVQAFRRAGEVLFIEVNPRYGGAAALGFAAGARTAEHAVRVAAGMPVEPRLDEYEADLLMLRHTEDLFLRPGQVLRGKTP